MYIFTNAFCVFQHRIPVKWKTAKIVIYENIYYVYISKLSFIVKQYPFAGNNKAPIYPHISTHNARKGLLGGHSTLTVINAP